MALGLSPTDLTDEIALLRTRIKLLLRADPDRLDILIPALGRLTRMVATHYHLSRSDGDRLTEAARTVLQEIEATLGGPEGD